jgi:hypothetical protein
MPAMPIIQGLTRFNGFELLAWDFNPRWAMRSSFSPLTKFANRIIPFAGGPGAQWLNLELLVSNQNPCFRRRTGGSQLTAGCIGV